MGLAPAQSTKLKLRVQYHQFRTSYGSVILSLPNCADPNTTMRSFSLSRRCPAPSALVARRSNAPRITTLTERAGNSLPAFAPPSHATLRCNVAIFLSNSKMGKSHSDTLWLTTLCVDRTSTNIMRFCFLSACPLRALNSPGNHQASPEPPQSAPFKKPLSAEPTARSIGNATMAEYCAQRGSRHPLL